MANESEKQLVQYRAKDGQVIKLTPEVIKRFLVSGNPQYVTDQELYFYMGVCKSRGLNPFIKDCYMIKYTPNDSAAIITSIDYYRKRARAQDDCVGWKTGIILIGIDGELTYREGCILIEGEELVGGWFEAKPKGWEIPMRKEVLLKRYIKKTKDGRITRFWSEDNQPEQIAKVAESQGLRATWPDEFQGLYVDAERESMEAQTELNDQVVKPETADTIEEKILAGEEVEPAKKAKEPEKTQKPEETEEKPAVDQNKSGEPNPMDPSDFINEWLRLHGENYEKYVLENLSRFDEFPKWVQKKARDKWKKMVGGPWPEPEAEIGGEQSSETSGKNDLDDQAKLSNDTEGDSKGQTEIVEPEGNGTPVEVDITNLDEFNELMMLQSRYPDIYKKVMAGRSLKTKDDVLTAVADIDEAV